MWHNLETIKYGLQGRGTIIYTAQVLKANPASRLQDDLEFKDVIFTAVNLDKGDKLLVGCVYRSPNSTNYSNSALN